uniref:Aftiphilin clathrin-binding box domain-containing protein n=1 Tax=Pavo cristatus TaxID=9049 RepID=A0A8C9F7S6_PAVCR
MQNLLLSGSRSSTDASHRACVTELGVGGMSGCENGWNSNTGTNNEGITHLEVTQQSLPVLNSDRRSCEGSDESGCTSAPSGSWGEFEGFREPLGKWQRFHPSPDILLKSKNASGGGTGVSRGHCSAAAGHFCSEPSLHSAIQEASSCLNEADLCYEGIFRSGFPEVFVSQSSERIRSLDQVLGVNNEDAGIPELTNNQLCIDSGNIWRTLRDSDNTPRLRHPWSKSRCQENLLIVLGIDTNRMDFPESQDDITEESNAKGNEDFRFDGFSINNCQAPIQTKLSVPSDSRQDQLFTCNLFLKTTSSDGNMQYITIPRKRHIFSTPNLNMKFFSSDVC